MTVGLSSRNFPLVSSLQIYRYEDIREDILDPRFDGRLAWNGSKNTKDLQDGSIFILNVTDEDKGMYKCIFRRRLIYEKYEFNTNTTKRIQLEVVDRRKDVSVPHAREAVETRF